MEKIRVSRDMLEKWVDQLYFEQTVVGAFVRMTIASSKERTKCVIGEVVRQDIDDGLVGRACR